MKSKIFQFALAGLLFNACSAMAAVVVVDEIQWLTDQGGANKGYNLDTISFTVNTGGNLTIDLLSIGAFPLAIDTMVYLAEDDGSLDNSDIIAVNDDGLLGSDGSIFSFDSYVEESLTVGNYLLVVGASAYSSSDLLKGFRVIGDSNATLEGLSLGDTYGSYQVTFSGDVTINGISSVTPVPLPAAGWLFLASVSSLVYRRFSKKA